MTNYHGQKQRKNQEIKKGGDLQEKQETETKFLHQKSKVNIENKKNKSQKKRPPQTRRTKK